MNDSHSVILHIGTHKTGTTSFQTALHDRAASLAERGIHLFASALSGVRGWAHELPLVVLRPELWIPLRDTVPNSLLQENRETMLRLIREQDETPQATLIASHEALSFIRETREVEDLVELFGGRPVHVVVTLRNRESFLRAWRGQLEKMGYSTVSAPSDSVLNASVNSWLTNWDQLIEVYSRVLGYKSVTVLNYEDCVGNDRSVVSSLWTAIGLPKELAPAPGEYWLNKTSEPKTDSR